MANSNRQVRLGKQERNQIKVARRQNKQLQVPESGKYLTAVKQQRIMEEVR